MTYAIYIADRNTTRHIPKLDLDSDARSSLYRLIHFLVPALDLSALSYPSLTDYTPMSVDV